MEELNQVSEIGLSRFPNTLTFEMRPSAQPATHMKMSFIELIQKRILRILNFASTSFWKGGLMWLKEAVVSYNQTELITLTNQNPRRVDVATLKRGKNVLT